MLCFFTGIQKTSSVSVKPCQPQAFETMCCNSHVSNVMTCWPMIGKIYSYASLGRKW